MCTNSQHNGLRSKVIYNAQFSVLYQIFFALILILALGSGSGSGSRGNKVAIQIRPASPPETTQSPLPSHVTPDPIMVCPKHCLLLCPGSTFKIERQNSTQIYAHVFLIPKIIIEKFAPIACICCAFFSTSRSPRLLRKSTVALPNINHCSPPQKIPFLPRPNQLTEGPKYRYTCLCGESPDRDTVPANYKKFPSPLFLQAQLGLYSTPQKWDLNAPPKFAPLPK